MELLSRYEIVFIVGCQRTGTTLLGNILGAHPRAFLIDEPNGLYPWVETIIADQDDDKVYTLFKRCCQSARKNLAKPDEKCHSNGKLSDSVTHLILKAPNLTYSADKIATHFSKPICIFMYRDIRDVVTSMGKVDWIPMVNNQLKRIKNNVDVANRFKLAVAALEDPKTQPHQARAYIAKIKTDLRDTFDQADIRKLEVGYENLVRSPDECLDRIWRHIKLPAGTSGSDHTDVMRGWGPGLTYRQSKVNVRSIGQWQQYLSVDQEDDVWEIAGTTMHNLNYSRKLDSAPCVPLWDSLTSELKHHPIIATGRGGSGTRLLSVLLQSLNIFTGNKLNRTEDSVEWVNILYKIALERFQPTAELPGNHWRNQLQEPAAEILAEGNWDGKQPWGWKLPETMLVLPVVFDSFRKGKLIHIVRHPVDTSLRRTHITSRAGNPVGKSVLEAAYSRLGWDQKRISSDPDYLRNAASWLYQVSEAARYGREELGPGRYLEIRYEDICADPGAVQKSLAEFLGIDRGPQPLDIEINPSRRREWEPPDSRADEIWDICGEAAMKLGYKPPEPSTS